MEELPPSPWPSQRAQCSDVPSLTAALLAVPSTSERLPADIRPSQSAHANARAHTHTHTVPHSHQVPTHLVDRLSVGLSFIKLGRGARTNAAARLRGRARAFAPLKVASPRGAIASANSAIRVEMVGLRARLRVLGMVAEGHLLAPRKQSVNLLKQLVEDGPSSISDCERHRRGEPRIKTKCACFAAATSSVQK